MLEKLRIIQEISSLFSGIQVHMTSASCQESWEQLIQTLSQRLGADLQSQLPTQQLRGLDSDNIYEFLPFPGVAILLYSHKGGDTLLCVGPVITEGYSSHNFLAYLQQQGISQKVTARLAESVSTLPPVPTYTLYRLMDILLRHLCGTDFPVPVKRMDTIHYFQPVSLVNDSTIPRDIRQIRQVENRYETSSILTEAVKLGNLSLALQTLHTQSNLHDLNMRTRNPLRNMQNYCIVLNTQLRHSLEGSGIHPYELDRLSNEIGMQIERLSDPDTAIPFYIYVIEQYCRLVQEQSYQNLSTLIHQAVIYLKNNLNANLTVKDTAKELSVHPDYLSHQFSKEMGMTFIAFMNQERCKQAASYLKHTSLQIKQISAVVGFNTISYFTKQFTQVYGKTPRDYRNEWMFHKQKASS